MPFNVSIYNDNILEGNEQFILNINNASLPDNVFANSSSTTTVVLRDDDSKLSLQRKFNTAYT